MSKVQEFQVEVFADYHQFYVQDGGVNPDAPTDWTDEDVESRAKVSQNVVVICPVRNMTVPVSVEVYDSQPSYELSHVDHAIRCSLALPTGGLQIHECTGGERLRVSITPGTYGVIALFTGLSLLSEDGLEGEDAYRVLLWPASAMPLEVLKRWDENAA